MRNEAHGSYGFGSSAVPLIGETIGDNFDRNARLHADREALVDVAAHRRWTYAELHSAVEDLACGLIARGIQKGDRVGVWSPNCAEWIMTQYATAKVGAILVNINPAYRTHELEYVVEQSGVRLIVSATTYRTSDYRGMLASIGFEDVVFIGDATWDAVLSAGSRVDREELAERSASLSFDEPINIQYTSGTTGFPKGATLSHHNILNNGYFVGEGVSYTENDRVCVPVPLYHCFGMVMGNLAAYSHGACVVLPSPTFEAEATLNSIQQEQCTSLYGVPTMFIAELGHERFHEFDLSSLRTGIMAGSPCPTEVMKRVLTDMHMPEVTICYGMTETSPVSLMTRRDDSLHQRTETAGQAMPHIEVKIVDTETGGVTARGQIGELCTRGYSVMLGYWDDAASTQAAIDTSRWMHTGDLAVMDETGYVTIVGRIKDMVIRGGENIYPREIEELLYTHPDISDVQVIGVPDERYGEELMAWIVMRPGAPELTSEALREFAQDKIARYKIPRYIHLVDGFPMTVTGKVRKVDMRKIAVETLGLQAAQQWTPNP